MDYMKLSFALNPIITPIQLRWPMALCMRLFLLFAHAERPSSRGSYDRIRRELASSEQSFDIRELSSRLRVKVFLSLASTHPYIERRNLTKAKKRRREPADAIKK